MYPWKLSEKKQSSSTKEWESSEDFSSRTPDSTGEIKRQGHLSIKGKWIPHSAKSAGK